MLYSVFSVFTPPTLCVIIWSPAVDTTSSNSPRSCPGCTPQTRHPPPSRKRNRAAAEQTRVCVSTGAGPALRKHSWQVWWADLERQGGREDTSRASRCFRRCSPVASGARNQASNRATSSSSLPTTRMFILGAWWVDPPWEKHLRIISRIDLEGGFINSDFFLYLLLYGFIVC